MAAEPADAGLPEPIEVRPARPDELEAAGAVVLRAYTADGLATARYRGTLLDARSRATDAEVAVALDAGVVVGSVTFALHGSRWAQRTGPGEAEFRMLGVDPAHHGRGVGTRLATWCIERARTAGARTLVISSDVRMAAAHRLYQRLGFVRRPDLDWVPEPGVSLLVFRLDLSGGDQGMS